MTKTSLPSVGFDRFVELAWMDHSLDIAVSNGEPELLKKWLINRIDGEESAIKTYQLLKRLWLRSFPETTQIRAKGLELVPEISQQNRIILHWCMALANFELFQQTTSAMGRLLRLQGSFNRKEIQQRMAEVYSNQGTIPRAVSRIVQSVSNWDVIKESVNHSYVNDRKITIREDDLLSFILLAALNRQRNRPISLIEVFRLPELFPFEFIDNGQRLIRESSSFTIIREGMNQEYVILS